MNSLANVSTGSEKRGEQRYALPMLEVVIAGERYHAINWSMRGALLYGIPEIVGMRVRGEIGVAGTSEGLPFAATVVRADANTGNAAICFEDARTDRIEFPEPVSLPRLQ